MNIIFLDIDGVLATNESYNTYLDVDGERYPSFDMGAVNAFNMLIKRTQAKVVISSTWRRLHSLDVLKKIFAQEGCVCDIIGVTPKDKDNCDRGEEIRKYISDHIQPHDKFVIIDDDRADIIGYYSGYLVWVERGFSKGGLRFDHVREAARILGVTNDKT